MNCLLCNSIDILILSSCRYMVTRCSIRLQENQGFEYKSMDHGDVIMCEKILVHTRFPSIMSCTNTKNTIHLDTVFQHNDNKAKRETIKPTKKRSYQFTSKRDFFLHGFKPNLFSKKKKCADVISCVSSPYDQLILLS